jgi:hypothetical protein
MLRDEKASGTGRPLFRDGSLDALRWAMPYVEANDLF